MFGGLSADLSYNASRFAGVLSRDSLSVIENNIKDKNNSCRKLLQESLRFNKLQKRFMRLDVLYWKLKQESFYLIHFVQQNLILVDNWFSLLDRC